LSSVRGAETKKEVSQVTRRLIYRPELLSRVGVSYPTVWRWMRAGTFPRSRVVATRTAWLEDELERWLDQLLPQRRLKGDADRAPGGTSATS
jgi:predicted DNA-binding transcriptional regulator AlpA